MNGIFEMRLLKMKKEKNMISKKIFKHRLSFVPVKNGSKKTYQKTL